MKIQVKIEGNENESPVTLAPLSDERVMELMEEFYQHEDEKVAGFFFNGIKEDRIFCICECEKPKIKQLKSISHKSDGTVIGSSHWRTERKINPKNFFIKLNGDFFEVKAEGKNLEIKSGNEEIILIAS